MKKYLVVLMTLLMSSSLLACNAQPENAADHSTTPAPTSAVTGTNTPAEPAASKQGETANEEQLQAATVVAKQYKETEYQVEDYTQLDMNFPSNGLPEENLENLDDSDVPWPPAMKEQYDRLLPYSTEKSLNKQLSNRHLTLPQEVAISQKTNLNATNLQLQADPTLKVKGILEIDYSMDVQLQAMNKDIPLRGELQLQQQEDGKWKVINDKYNMIDLQSLVQLKMAGSPSS